MKKTLLRWIAVLLLLCLSCTWAGAKTLYDQCWQPGEYVLETIDERRAQHEALWQRVQELAEGSPIKEANEANTLECQYKQYLQLGEVPERIYADVGAYTWAVGLPDDQSIGREEAYMLACVAAETCFRLTMDNLSHYWPMFSYITADPQNPVWEISFLCYDGTADENVLRTVGVYAHDGSICGVRCTKPVG